MTGVRPSIAVGSILTKPDHAVLDDVLFIPQGQNRWHSRSVEGPYHHISQYVGTVSHVLFHYCKLFLYMSDCMKL